MPETVQLTTAPNSTLLFWSAPQHYLLPTWVASSRLPAEASLQYLDRSYLPELGIWGFDYSEISRTSRVNVVMTTESQVAFAGIESGKPQALYYYASGDVAVALKSLEEYAQNERIGKNRVEFYSSPLAEKYEQAMRYVSSRIRVISQLKEDWNSEGARSISWQTLARSLSLFGGLVEQAGRLNIDLPVPSLSPLPSGGVEFEFNSLLKELMVAIPKDITHPVRYLKVDKSGISEVEEESQCTDQELIGLAMALFGRTS